MILCPNKTHDLLVYEYFVNCYTEASTHVVQFTRSVMRFRRKLLSTMATQEAHNLYYGCYWNSVNLCICIA